MAALICGGSCWRLSPVSVDQSFRLLTGPPWAAAGDVIASASSAMIANVLFMVAGPPELSPLVATGLGQLCYIGQHRRHGGRAVMLPSTKFIRKSYSAVHTGQFTADVVFELSNQELLITDCAFDKIAD